MALDVSKLKPVIFDWEVPIRFSDLDPYRHVNAARYMDLVVQSRWDFQKARFHMTPDDYLKRGLALWVSRFEIEFKRAIQMETDRIRVRSWCDEVREVRFSVAFEMTSGDTLHAKGRYESVVIDAKTGRPTSIPEWMYQYGYELPAMDPQVPVDHELDAHRT